MGIVNITPDSFSDGVRCLRTEAALSRARTLAREGADILDLGAESTRPGATPISWQAEWARLEPVLRVLAREQPTMPISIDTYHPETAERALCNGAAILNCVYAKSVPAMLELARKTRCGLVLPASILSGNRQSATDSASPLPALHSSLAALRSQLVIDPMIGFGTTREEDVAILGGIRRLAQKAPVLAGVSRKRVIGALTGANDPMDRLGGSVGAAVWCALNGASVIRVHDVKETRQALQVAEALAAAAQNGGVA
ncbi:MAG: dihydropteroate synthase [Kiritimatiellae bacterium]|nr:dihydropteroate synthase [Kiritimatiellia bacterium]